MSRSSSWPISETRGFRAVAEPRRPARTRQPFPRIGWVLAIAAFLCGAMLSAAAVSVGWKNEAQRGSDVQAALDRATAQSHELAGSLADAHASTASAQAAARRARTQSLAAKASAAALLQRAQGVATALNSASTGANAVTSGSSAVSSDLAKLTSELRALTSYIDNTPASQLDSGYVATQTAYITKTISRIGAEQSDLGSAVDAYMQSVQQAASRAAALSGKN